MHASMQSANDDPQGMDITSIRGGVIDSFAVSMLATLVGLLAVLAVLTVLAIWQAPVAVRVAIGGLLVASLLGLPVLSRYVRREFRRTRRRRLRA